jgi:hypothetical protein
MFIERIPNRNSPPAILIRESYREGQKVIPSLGAFALLLSMGISFLNSSMTTPCILSDNALRSLIGLLIA